MMLKTILFALLFVCFAIGGLIEPIFGILGYMLHYIVGPERQWWHAPLNPLGLRYSFILAAITAVGIVLNRTRLRFGKLLMGQEKLALLMLALIWALTLLGPETVGRYTITDHASIKMTKVMIFCLMMTHVVTQSKDLDKVFWLLVVGSLILGLQAYDVPRRAFTGGRLDAVVGGSDFLDSNALASFMVAATVITGVMFMRSSWRGKLLSAAAGVFSVNTIVLCRSRGALLALCGAGIAIVLMAPKRFRIKLMVGMVVAAAGLLYLSDPQFLTRMGDISTHADAVLEGREASDRSTMMRIEAWKGGLKMLSHNPFGVGPGNFNQNIGRYSPDVAGMSPHSTYIQSATELGLPGLALFLAILGNAWWTVRKVIRECEQSEQLPENQRLTFQWTACSLGAVVVGWATYGLTGHLMYVESFWWYLMLPVCLQRAFENAREDVLAEATSSQDE
jgi:O-antigen ligase